MYTNRGCPSHYKSPVLLLMLAVLLVALVGCRERQGATNDGAGTISPQAQEATQIAATAAPISSQEDREMAINRIAYIGSDGNIFTIKPDGTDSRRITLIDLRAGSAGNILAQVADIQTFYAWPTWSPDSTKLAASLVTLDEGRASFSLDVVDASTGRATRVYDNEPDTIAIARGDPHYTYWSPDSKHLAFLASTPAGQTLFLSTPGEGNDPASLDQGGFTYLSWAGDSSALLIHRGPELLLISATGEGLDQPRSLGTVGDGFRAPAISSDAEKMVYATGDDTGSALYLADTQPRLAGARPILDIGASSAFQWSPTRDEIAVADASDAGELIFERLTIVSSDGESQRTLVNEPLLAFFWSPDGEKIAYVAVDRDGSFFTWKYVDRTEGTPVELVEFLPSPQFLTLFSFFDQYSYSNSLWSPDSSKILFSGAIRPSSPSRNGGSPEGNKVYVLDISGGSGPREIATSRFAVWSWK